MYKYTEIYSNSERVLDHALAEKQYKDFRITQDKNYISDFDKIINRLKKPRE